MNHCTYNVGRKTHNCWVVSHRAILEKAVNWHWNIDVTSKCIFALIGWWKICIIRSYCLISVRYKEKGVTHQFSNAFNIQVSFKGSSMSLSMIIFLVHSEVCFFSASSLFFQPAKKNVAKHWWGGLTLCSSNSDYLPKSTLTDVLSGVHQAQLFQNLMLSLYPLSDVKSKSFINVYQVFQGEFEGGRKKESCS